MTASIGPDDGCAGMYHSLVAVPVGASGLLDDAHQGRLRAITMRWTWLVPS